MCGAQPPTTPHTAAPPQHTTTDLVEADDVWMPQQLHDLNLAEDFLQIVLVQLRLVYDFYGDLQAETRALISVKPHPFDEDIEDNHNNPLVTQISLSTCKQK